MIIADKIAELRKRNGWSQEDLAEKLQVSRQSVSKWEMSQSMPDMAKIVQMSDLFGVSTDVLLKDSEEIGFQGPVQDRYPEDPKYVSMEEASSYMDDTERLSGKLAAGVAMCILSPVLLILIETLREYGVLPIQEDRGVGLGLLVLFLLVGGAVAIFVLYGLKMSRYEYLEKQIIDTAYGVDGAVRERRERFRNTFNVRLTVGIVLCVMSVVPIFLTMAVMGEDGMFTELSVCTLLVMVAAGVFLIVSAAVVWGSFKRLLQEDDYTPMRKTGNRRSSWLDQMYWSLATALFLGYSFVTNRWDRSWIIWPVAGVLYGAVEAAMKAFGKKDDD